MIVLDDDVLDRPFVQSTVPPIGVSTLSVAIELAKPSLSLGLGACLIAAMPTSHSDEVGAELLRPLLARGLLVPVLHLLRRSHPLSEDL